jgi:hypothetical protein
MTNYQIGDTVYNKRYGYGIISEFTRYRMVVEFDSYKFRALSFDSLDLGSHPVFLIKLNENKE